MRNVVENLEGQPLLPAVKKRLFKKRKNRSRRGFFLEPTVCHNGSEREQCPQGQSVLGPCEQVLGPGLDGGRCVLQQLPCGVCKGHRMALEARYGHLTIAGLL